MLIVALTGGIATGKSIVAGIWEELGCYIHQADLAAQELMEPGSPVWEKITERFGADILDPETRAVDRKRLGMRVFTDPEDREFLNRLVHPLVLEKKKEDIARLRALGRHWIFVSEAALTIEAGYTELFHKVVVTFCPLDIQVGRLEQRDGIGREEALGKIRTQMPAEDKLAYADYVIRTGGSLAATIEQAEQVLRYLRQDYLLLFPPSGTD
jgi:dephospho-CoA kinase